MAALTEMRMQFSKVWGDSIVPSMDWDFFSNNDMTGNGG